MDEEVNRAAIMEIDRATGKQDCSPQVSAIPTAWIGTIYRRVVDVVNERDEIGSDLVPDYLTSVKDGGFYGWPYSYYGQHVDKRVAPQKPDLVAKAIVPTMHSAHTSPRWASRSIARNAASEIFRRRLHRQHGSWNRKPFSGYNVVFVPFSNGKPSGKLESADGLRDADGNALGRPLASPSIVPGAVGRRRRGNVVWRVTPSR